MAISKGSIIDKYVTAGWTKAEALERRLDSILAEVFRPGDRLPITLDGFDDPAVRLLLTAWYTKAGWTVDFKGKHRVPREVDSLLLVWS